MNSDVSPYAGEIVLALAFLKQWYDVHMFTFPKQMVNYS